MEKLSFVIIVLFVATFAINYGEPKSVARENNLKISNGEEAIPHSAPFMVDLSITIKGDDSDLMSINCGGTLISHYYVLTAAHCLRGAMEIYALVGAHNASADGDIITGVGYLAAGTSANADIAVVKLSEPVTFSDTVQPVKLPSKAGVGPYAGQTGVAYGWGMMTEDVEEYSEVLMQTELKVIPREKCKELVPNERIYKTYICTASPDGRGICPGDSGGPLIINGTQVGVIVRLFGKCGSDAPNAFIKVSNFFDFIERSTDVVIPDE